MKNKKKVVVIGGGTGAYTVLKGLKRFNDLIDISAIISMADSGGSTGRLRDDFGQLPVGDVRMALCALAREYDEEEELMRELFLYRFDRGAGLSGHNFGNLFLTALTDILGSEEKAVTFASKILRIYGRVIPVTADNIQLEAVYEDGLTVSGEHHIDNPPDDRFDKRIVELKTLPQAVASKDAIGAIVDADLVVVGPGDLYSSLLPNFLVAGIPESLSKTKAKKVFVSNLMERPGQTVGMGLSDYIKELERYGRCVLDYVLINNNPLPTDLVDYYWSLESVRPVINDLSSSVKLKLVSSDLLAPSQPEEIRGDLIKRSLIRHDPDKLAKNIVELLD